MKLTLTTMNKPWDEPMPLEEIERFKTLKDIQVVFDVGARTSLDYYNALPTAQYHLFEPWPPFFAWLMEEAKDKPNVTVNGFGLSDKEETIKYNLPRQAFLGGECPDVTEGVAMNVTTLDWYIDKFNITRLDFLKIDAEGYDYKILKGGPKAIKLAKYIQYEHWDDLKQFEELLGEEFEMEYIGMRNVLCKRKK